MKRLLLIDAFNYIHRAYHALPKTFRTKEGEMVNAIYGTTSMVISTLDILKPTHAIAAFEAKEGEVLRLKDFEKYKANRKEMEEDLRSQIPKIEEIIRAFGISVVSLPGYEADDIIGFASKKAVSEGFEVVIVSNDRDIYQLLGPHVAIFTPDNSKEGGKFFGETEFKEKYGFGPAHMIDYKALRGDASDNIPGVLGIGDKGASELIRRYKTVEKVYEDLDNLPTTLKKKLDEGRASAFLSKKIVTIALDLPIELDLESCRVRQVDRANVVEILRGYNFKSLIRRMGFEVEGDEKKKEEVSKDQLSLF